MHYSREEILAVMPYGTSFCFLDTAEVINGQMIYGTYTVKVEDCDGHFKTVAVFPGALYMEIIAQLGVFWLRIREGFQDYIAVYDGPYTGNEIGFSIPGDVLQLEFEVIEFDGRRKGKAKGKILKSGATIQKAEFSFKIMKQALAERMFQPRTKGGEEVA